MIGKDAGELTASLWLERAEKHNPKLPTPGSPMAADIAVEMEEYADQKLAAFLRAQSTPASAGVLVERLQEMVSPDGRLQISAKDGIDKMGARELETINLAIQALSTTATPASDGVRERVEEGHRLWCRYLDGAQGPCNCGYHIAVAILDEDPSTPTPDRFGEGYRAGVRDAAGVAKLNGYIGDRHRTARKTAEDIEERIRALQPATGGEA
jgi:hypothetical protein